MTLQEAQQIQAHHKNRAAQRAAQEALITPAMRAEWLCAYRQRQRIRTILTVMGCIIAIPACMAVFVWTCGIFAGSVLAGTLGLPLLLLYWIICFKA